MANFAASILSGTTPDITSNGVATSVVDHSNYASSEAGHAQANFISFRKVKFINPDNTSYLFSTLGDGDALTIPAAGATLPITDVYNYTTGDGVYTLILYTLPDYSAAASYVFTNTPYVYYSGVVYKALQNSTNKQPDIEPTYWEVVSSIDDLPTKYRVEQKYSVICDILQCFARKEAASMCNVQNCAWSDLPKNKNFFDAQVLGMIIEYVPILSDNGSWSEVANLINKGKQLCCCGS